MKGSNISFESHSKVPLIGILVHSDINSKLKNKDYDGNYFLASSYVDWVALSGAIPVLIPSDMPLKKFELVLETIQGLVIPGGSSDLYDEEGAPRPPMEKILHTIKYCKNLFDEKKKKFVVFGICYGFQALVCSLLGSEDVLSQKIKDYYKAHPVVYEEDANSRFFCKLNPQLRKEVFSNPSVYYWHGYSLCEQDLQLDKFKIVKEEFNFLGYSKSGENHDGDDFLVLLESKKYPIYATQFHPEKTSFDRSELTNFVDRSESAINLMKELSDLVVDEIKENITSLNSIPDWIRPLMSISQEMRKDLVNDLDGIYIVKMGS